MYQSCESKNCWSATSLINQFDDKQNEWCEELWRLDYVRKYERPYREGNTRFLEQMMNGKKKYQRRQFERDQEIYMATKFLGTSATSNQIMFRCNTPVGAVVKPDYTLHLTPYSDMYLSVMFGNSSAKQVRAKAGQVYDITCPYDTMDDTAVLIYAASRIQSMGDVSTCYIHDNDFSKAERLKELIIGNITEGYSNTFLTNLVIGNNKLLEKLDIRNTPNLSTSLDFSKCLNLKELYASGSGLTGVLFANGGKISTALLPATLSSINMKNLQYLTNLQIAGFDKISTMIIENCSVVDCKTLIEQSKNANRVRITGINWQLDDTSLLDRIYSMKGIDRNGYNTDQSVLAGSVHVPVMREKKLTEYRTAWPDLIITYNTLVEQFTILFKNDDGTILDTQYVDKGSSPVDPLTRDESPISKPLKASTAQFDYEFAGWDKNFVAAFSDGVYTATYTPTEVDEKIAASKGEIDKEIKANTDAIAKLNGAETVDGSVKKQIKDASEAINSKIGTMDDLTTADKATLVGAMNEIKSSVDSAVDGGKVTVATETTSEGMLKSYTIKQGGKDIAVIDIPKDMVVKSGTVVTDPVGQAKGTYLVLTLANATEDKVYINVGTLVDIYTAKADATQVQLSINPATREISATIVAGSIGTAELADGAVTKVKLAKDVQASLEKANTALQEADIASLKADVAANKASLAEGGATANAIKANKEAAAKAQADVDALEKRVVTLESVEYKAATEEEIKALFPTA